MNYREPLTKNEIREHAAHYENSNPAVYCGTYAKYNNGSLYGYHKWNFIISSGWNDWYYQLTFDNDFR